MSILPDGQRIRELRNRLGLTQADLAKLSGFGKRTVEHAESGRRRVRKQTLSTIATALGVPFERLVQTFDTLDHAMRLDYAGDFRRAMEVARRLRANTKPGSAEHTVLTIRLATFLDHANRLTEALEALQEVGESETSGSRWCSYQKGIIIRRLGELAQATIGPRAAASLFAEARDRFTPLAALRDEDIAVAAQHQLGVIALAKRQFARAAAIFERCLECRMAHTRADAPDFRAGYEHRRLGQAYASLGRRQVPEEHFAAAARIAHARQHWRLLAEVRRDLAKFGITIAATADDPSRTPDP